jgi:hypothetical protein
MKQRTLVQPGSILREVFDGAVATFLDRGTVGASVRLALLGTLLALYWFALALRAGFPRVLPEAWTRSWPFPFGVFADVAASFFAPAVLLHLIPVFAGLWLALRLGTHYLADLFELESERTASRYLRAALFGLGYQVLEVGVGDRDLLDASHHLLRIGGPGYLNVQLGFSAVVETVERQPMVVGPTRGWFMHGFDRLRDVIDLRDQLRQVDQVRALTRDGIEVSARDVQMVFRVYAGGRPRDLHDPHPFTEEAVRRLVYGQAVSEQGRHRWTDALTDLVAREIQSFVAGLTLDEFLTMQPVVAPDEAEGDRGFHIPRRDLTERFHTPETRQRLADEGLELLWVGVGTWEVPPQTNRGADGDVREALMAAWRDLQWARRQKDERALQRHRRRSREAAGHRLLRELVETWQASRREEPRLRTSLLLRTLLEQLVRMRDALSEAPAEALPLDYPAAIDHLHALIRSEVSGDGRV